MNNTALNLNITEVPSRAAQKSSFFESNDAMAAIGVCQSCQEYVGLGIVYGRPGFGKTFSLEYYAKLPHVVLIKCSSVTSCSDIMRKLERKLGIPRTCGTIEERADAIKDFFNINKGYLIIVDEADKLISKAGIKKIEVFRDIYDQSSVGVVLAGEPMLKTSIASFDSRLNDRLVFQAELRGLSAAEVESYLDGWNIDGEALDELKARAYSSRSGCFRQFNVLLSNIKRVMKSSEQKITMKTIQQAYAIMNQ